MLQQISLYEVAYHMFEVYSTQEQSRKQAPDFLIGKIERRVSHAQFELVIRRERRGRELGK
jgi:hypothetical protein